MALLISLLPAVLLMLFLYKQDPNKEPVGWIVRGFWYGILSAVIAVIVELPLEWVYEQYLSNHSVVGAVYRAFIGAAVPEECAKLLMLWWLVKRNPYFDEYMDGLIYAVAIGLGFASIENIVYVFVEEDSWLRVAVFRAVFAVPGHYAFAMLMGFFFSLCYFQPQRFGRFRWLVLVAPIVAHGIYDSLIMWMSDYHPNVNVVLFIVLVRFVRSMHKYCYRKMLSLAQRDIDTEHLARFREQMFKKGGMRQNTQ